ncbi:hypothetical protein O181_065083 [Austropuccinia psidii MF-1]|uniref:Uncharacterized protein n=1 Tax=Austropuccinia psidii MF-1 TaxID=1389203 RepID=A0A9Q3I287_9BASI|nr:hypothetical protein [Austropuccinia psidii MF-1]
MPSAAPSWQTTLSELDHTTQASNSETTTNDKKSWMWPFFTEVDGRHVECQVTNRSGIPCKKNSTKANREDKMHSKHWNAIRTLQQAKNQARLKPDPAASCASSAACRAL